MNDSGIKVEGAARLRRTLKAAGADMKDVKDLHRQIASVVAQASRQTTPTRTGRLAATVRPGATQTAAVVRAGNKSVPYANPIHWGWYRRGIKPQPWLSQAAQSTEPAWSGKYFDGIEKIIGKIEGA